MPEEVQEPSVYQSYTEKPEVRQRLIVVANRLPVSASRDKKGNWELQVCLRPRLQHFMSSSTLHVMTNAVADRELEALCMDDTC